MKKIKLIIILITSIFLHNCVGEYLRDDAIPEEIRISNIDDLGSIPASQSFQLEFKFFDKAGAEDNETPITWSSADTSIATVTQNGLVTGVSEGFTNIVAQAVVEDKTIEEVIPITITPDTTVPKPDEIVILNPTGSIMVGETYQYNATYFNSLGEEESVSMTWSSSSPSIATVNDNGLITGISTGVATIKVETIIDNNTIESTTTISIEAMQTSNEKSGTIVTTSSYTLNGTFTLSEIEGTNNLRLSINSDYQASTSLPGLYIYLSNNPNSIGNALEIGPVTTFNGAHSYTINNTGLNDYSHVLYWCKPFGVKVGEGEIL